MFKPLKLFSTTDANVTPKRNRLPVLDEEGSDNNNNKNDSSPYSSRENSPARTAPTGSIPTDLSLPPVGLGTKKKVAFESSSSTNGGIDVTSTNVLQSTSTSTPSCKTATLSSSPKANDKAIVTPKTSEKTNNSVSQKVSAKKRQTPLMQTKYASLACAKEFMELRETVWKSHQELLKKHQKEVKATMDALSKKEAELAKQDEATKEAFEQKKEAAKAYRKLLKQWEKCEAADFKKDSERKEAKAEATKLKKRVANQSPKENESATKKQNPGPNVKKTAKAKKTATMRETNDEEEHEFSSDDESDWEGASKSKRTGTAIADTSAAEPSPKRTKRHRRAEWQCSRCTLLNPMADSICGACQSRRH